MSAVCSSKFVTIYCLLYGDFHPLHKRLLSSLLKRLPDGVADVVIWCNLVCPATLEWLAKNNRADWTCINSSSRNVPKYEVMRELFHEHTLPFHERTIPETPWILWLDDDTHIVDDAWWEKTVEYIKAKQAENICYVGQPWYVHYLEGQEEFIKAAKWYRGMPLERHPTRNPKVRKPGIKFATGSYVWLRTDVMKQLNWPDPRLVHNGGDTLLGEAIRQQGLPRHSFYFGVKVNDGKRRGLSEAPAGSANKRVRR